MTVLEGKFFNTMKTNLNIKGLIILFIIFSFQNIFGANMDIVERRVVSGIESYKKTEYSYLTREELRELKKLRKIPLLIGVPDHKGYSSLEMDGREYGMVHLYKKLLEKHFNLKVELYHGEWGELVGKLQEGEIDLLLGMTPTPERKDKINFTIPYIPDRSAVIMLSDNKITSYEDLKGKKVFLRKGSYYETLGRKKGEIYGFETEAVASIDYSLVGDDTVVFGTEELLSELLGEERKGLRIEEIFFENPVAIGIARGKGDLFYSIINKSLKEVFYKAVSEYSTELKWEMKKALFRKNLSEEEKAFLTQKKTLDIYFEDDSFPHIFYNDLTRRHEGVQVEVLGEVAEALELELNVLNEPGTSWKEVVSRYSTGKGDFLILFKTSEREKSYIFSKEIYHEDVLLVGDRNHEFVTSKLENHLNYRVGVVESDGTHILAKRYYSDENLILAKDSDSLIEMLEKKKVDFIVIDKGELAYLQSYKFKTNLITITNIDRVPIAFAMKRANKGQGEVEEKLLLRSILDKALTYCIETDSKYQRWSTYPNDVGKKLKTKNRNLLILLIFFMTGCVKLFINKRIIKKQKDNLYNLLHYDQEVGCKNRASSEIDLKKVIKTGRKGSVILYSIEGLYELSSIYGYKKIDAAMRRGVGKVEVILGKRGEVYRISKDEFGILLLDRSRDKVMAIAQEILRELVKPDVIDEEDHNNIRIAMGVAHSTDKKNLGVTAKEAQMAHHLAKIKNETNLYEAEEDILDKFNEEMRMEEDIKRALRRREFVPYYQLKRDVKTGEVLGCEALARWISEKKGFISPGEFIPLAESTGHILRLDLQIIEKSMAQLKRWIERKVVDGKFKMSVNLSVRTIEKEDIVGDIEYFLEKYKLDPKYIEIEVTETIFGGNSAKIKKNLEGLRGLGLSLALDDFSAGHSSAKYLLEFNFDVVKLDRSLLPEDEKDGPKRKIYKTLVEMIKTLQMTSVGEGVETLDQLEMLRELEVDEVQGYYYNKPLSAKGVEKVL